MRTIEILNTPKTIEVLKTEVSSEYFYISHDQSTRKDNAT